MAYLETSCNVYIMILHVELSTDVVFSLGIIILLEFFSRACLKCLGFLCNCQLHFSQVKVLTITEIFMCK